MAPSAAASLTVTVPVPKGSLPPAAARPSVASALGLSAVAIAVFVAVVLFGFGGWTYYTTPVAVRGYDQAHRLLRPSGRAGQWFGIGGFLLMLVPIAYAVRKRVRRFREAGSMKTWLEVHVFAGIVGPVLITFHTSFKFNGIVSVAYWSMVAVMLSGFVGRYLYVRIPRTLRGVELTRGDLDARAAQLSRQLADSALPPGLVAKIAAFEREVVPSSHSVSIVGLFFGELGMRRELERLRREVEHAHVGPDLFHSTLMLIAERATLLRRAAYLHKAKRLFDAWHVFHMPLVYVMFAIVVLHVAFTMYLGYLPFGP